VIKLSPGEAKKLADLLQNLCRPRSEAEGVEVQNWIKRLRADR
jgi:hypothetical protein